MESEWEGPYEPLPAVLCLWTIAMHIQRDDKSKLLHL